MGIEGGKSKNGGATGRTPLNWHRNCLKSLDGFRNTHWAPRSLLCAGTVQGPSKALRQFVYGRVVLIKTTLPFPEPELSHCILNIHLSQNVSSCTIIMNLIICICHDTLNSVGYDVLIQVPLMSSTVSGTWCSINVNWVNKSNKTSKFDNQGERACLFSSSHVEHWFSQASHFEECSEDYRRKVSSSFR